MTSNSSSLPRTLVMKFGGTSVGTPEAMSQVVAIVRRARPDWPRLVVVTSALAGVTNLLLDRASRSVTGGKGFIHQSAAELREAHLVIAETLIPKGSRLSFIEEQVEALVAEFEDLCQAISVLGECSPRALDAVAALGERLSVRLLWSVLETNEIPAEFVEATRLIVTDDVFQAAHPDLEATTRQTRQVLEPVLTRGRVPIVTGFIAATSQGVTTTLGRGGSDYSAALLAAVLPANEVWIWTDVDGIMTADPRLVPEARTIPTLTYREIAELAYFGAKVVHPKTIRPVIEAGIGLRVCNTFNPDHPGSRLVIDDPFSPNTRQISQSNHIIKAVTAIRGQRLITIEGRGMLGVPGVAARAFGAVAATGTSVPLISQASSEQSICFAVPEEATTQVIASLEAAFDLELARRDIDRVWATDEVVILTAVGAGMRNTPGVAGQIFNALGVNDVNVIAIAQGSSEVSISMVVAAQDAETAVRALHQLIIERR